MLRTPVVAVVVLGVVLPIATLGHAAGSKAPLPAGWAPGGKASNPHSQIKADTVCGPNSALLFSARGSGDKYGAKFAHNRIGQWTQEAGNVLGKYGWSVRDLQAIYPAPGIPSYKKLAAAALLGSATGVALVVKDYRDAPTKSWRSVKAELVAAYRRCPSRPILLAGYSQGAILLRYVVPRLPAAILRKIVSVDLIADPTEQAAVDSGLQHPAKLAGLLTTDGIDTWAGSLLHAGTGFRQTPYPSAIRQRVYQYCYAADFVCNFTTENLAGPNAHIEAETHTSYGFGLIGVVAARRLGHYAAGGALDTGFGKAGKVVTHFGSSSDAYAWGAAVQKNGKIVLAGISNEHFALARYTKDGNLDKRFGRGGKVLTKFGSSSLDGARAVAIEKNGKIVAAGNSNYDFAVARYTKRGTLDSSFGTGGKVLTGPGTENEANAVAIQPDGKIVVAGESFVQAKNTWEFSLVRYTKSGALDRSFGARGEVLTGLGPNGSGSDGDAYAVAIQPDGKIVVCGTGQGVGSVGYDFAVLRYTKKGALDTTFGAGGKVLTDMGSVSSDEIHAIALQPDGKIVLAGTTTAHGKYYFALARYLKNGTLDPDFGAGGKVLTAFGSSSALALEIQKNGKIVVAGGRNTDANGRDHFAVARYTKSGRLDPNFGAGGKVLTDFGAPSDADAVVIQKSGRIVVAGVRYASHHYAFALAGYLGR